MDKLSYDYLELLRKTHPAIRILNADNASLIISFLNRAFIVTNRRSIPYSELVSKLDDYLHQINKHYDIDKYPRSAKAYIEEWLGDRCEYLRQYYAQNSDQPEIDLTPAVEKVIEWLHSFDQAQFVATESRLLHMLHYLRELKLITEQDPAIRIQELAKQKAAIESEIEKAKSGIIERFDGRQIKERFLQAEEIARKLLSDFRQVEYNLRALDKDAREQIAASDNHKGKLLDSIFEQHDVIQDSDQGKSFKAFWEFLMSPDSQDELLYLLNRIYELDDVLALNPNDFLKKINSALLNAGEKVYKTSTLLAEQLRKFLESQAYLENQYIIGVIKNIEKMAITVKSNAPKNKSFALLDDLSPTLDLVMLRTLFTPPQKPVTCMNSIEAGEADIRLDILYEQVYVDEVQLLHNIQRVLQEHSQVSLKQLIEIYPIEKGLEEVIAYLNIACKNNHIINIDVIEHFRWSTKKITMPQVIFCKE